MHKTDSSQMKVLTCSIDFPSCLHILSQKIVSTVPTSQRKRLRVFWIKCVPRGLGLPRMIVQRQNQLTTKCEVSENSHANVQLPSDSDLFRNFIFLRDTSFGVLVVTTPMPVQSRFVSSKQLSVCLSGLSDICFFTFQNGKGKSVLDVIVMLTCKPWLPQQPDNGVKEDNNNSVRSKSSSRKSATWSLADLDVSSQKARTIRTQIPIPDLHLGFTVSPCPFLHAV